MLSLWQWERAVHLCELCRLATFLSSTHCFIMCNYESDLISLLKNLSSQCHYKTAPLFDHYQAVFPRSDIQRTYLKLGSTQVGDPNESRQTDLFTRKWKNGRERKKREGGGLACVQELDRRHRTRKNDPHCATEFELAVPFAARPRQIYQSSFNVIYSHGVERK